MKTMKHTNRVYLRNDFGEPYGCLLLRRADDVLQCGISICSPNDQFCKWTGYKLATERLMNSPFQVHASELLWGGDETYWNFINDLCEHARISSRSWPAIHTTDVQAIRTALKYLYRAGEV